MSPMENVQCRTRNGLLEIVCTVETSYQTRKNAVEHIGTNASPYCKGPYGMPRSCKERDLREGSTDTPHAAIQQATVTVELDEVLQNPLRQRWMRMEPEEKQNPIRFSVGSMSD